MKARESGMPEEGYWAESVGFEFQHKYDLKPYHYGVAMKK